MKEKGLISEGSKSNLYLVMAATLLSTGGS